jgi:hypothetical protein
MALRRIDAASTLRRHGAIVQYSESPSLWLSPPPEPTNQIPGALACRFLPTFMYKPCYSTQTKDPVPYRRAVAHFERPQPL